MADMANRRSDMTYAAKPNALSPGRAGAACDMEAGSLVGGVLMTIHRLSQGGADRVAMLLANGFAAAGIPTGIAMLRGGGEAQAILLDIAGRDVAVSSAGPPMGSRHLELARGFGYIRRQVSLARPSVVLATSSNMGLITGLSAVGRRRSGPKHVMKLTNPVIRPRDRGAIKESYRRTLYDFIFGNYDRILILTDAERETLTRMFPRHRDRFETAANPYVTSAMSADFRHQFRSGPPNILALARMMPQKRLDRLLLAFARVKQRESRLTILGDGPERSRLERLTRSLGIEDRVAMPRFVDDVVPWLRRADLFVLSSDFEGLPAAVIEALACNVPVVTTDCFEGARSLLAGAERCYVVPVDDSDALAAAIDRSLTVKSAPDNLREIARGYSIEAGISAHLDMLKPLLDPDCAS